MGTVWSSQEHTSTELLFLSYIYTSAPLVPSSVPVDVVVCYFSDPEIRQREHPLPGDDHMRTLGEWRAE